MGLASKKGPKPKTIIIAQGKSSSFAAAAAQSKSLAASGSLDALLADDLDSESDDEKKAAALAKEQAAAEKRAKEEAERKAAAEALAKQKAEAAAKLAAEKAAAAAAAEAEADRLESSKQIGKPRRNPSANDLQQRLLQRPSRGGILQGCSDRGSQAEDGGEERQSDSTSKEARSFGAHRLHSPLLWFLFGLVWLHSFGSQPSFARSLRIRPSLLGRISLFFFASLSCDRWFGRSWPPPRCNQREARSTRILLAHATVTSSHALNSRRSRRRWTTDSRSWSE